MLSLNGTRYPLFLLDTMAASEIAKDPTGVGQQFRDTWSATDPPFIPCFSVFTLLELQRRVDVFDQFITAFQCEPCLLIKSYRELIEEEVRCYPDPTVVEPGSIAFTPLGGAGHQLTVLPSLLGQLEHQASIWRNAGASIVDGMVSLVQNYQPARENYTREEVRLFAWMTAYSQLCEHQMAFAQREAATEQVVDVDAFPSLKAMAYTVFYKFYADRDRTPGASDAFDVLIASSLPYVEAVATERHLADALRKVRGRDKFLNHLEVFTMRDFAGRTDARS